MKETNLLREARSECMESSNNPLQLDRSTMPPADASRSCKLVTGKGKLKKNDLPQPMWEDMKEKFMKVVLPSLVLWYGDEANIWSYSEESLANALAVIIGVVYPAFEKFDKIGYGSAIYTLVCSHISLLPAHFTGFHPQAMQHLS